MTLKQNQPKSGHLRGVSINPVQKTGRPDGSGNKQDAKSNHVSDTYPHAKNQPNPMNRPGRSTPEGQRDRGFPRGYVQQSPGVSPTDHSAPKRNKVG